jgi:lipoate-protein ligase B
MVPYERAWRLQERLADEIASGERPPTLLLLEHPHTYTFGRRGNSVHLLWDETELARRGISVHWIDRGGDVTYHGQGQLVGYPLLPLAPGGLQMTPGAEDERDTVYLPRADYVGYLRKLEHVLILALSRWGVVGKQVEELTGVWVERNGRMEKIAAIGVKVDVNGISRHGFAINLDTDMSYWEGIIACGLGDYRPVNLSNLLDPAPKMEQLKDEVVNAFAAVFGCQMFEDQPLGNDYLDQE